MDSLVRIFLCLAAWILIYIPTTDAACPTDTAQFLDRCLWVKETAMKYTDAIKSTTCKKGGVQGRLAKLDVVDLALFAAHFAKITGAHLRIGTKSKNSRRVWMDDESAVTWGDWFYSGTSGVGSTIIASSSSFYNSVWVTVSSSTTSTSTYKSLCESLTSVQGCQVRWLPRYGYQLSGGNKRTLSSVSIFKCLYQCQRDSACLSVDYDIKDKRCHLIEANEKTLSVEKKSNMAHFDYFCQDNIVELVEGPLVTLSAKDYSTKNKPAEGILRSLLGFISSTENDQAWLQVKFNEPVIIYAILMRGIRDGSLNFFFSTIKAYTKDLYLLYREKNGIWKYYCQKEATPYNILANTEDNHVSGHYLKEPVKVTSLMLNLRGFTTSQGIRFGAYGRKISSIDDSFYNAVGVESGHIMDSQMSANDFYSLHHTTDRNYSPWSGRLNHKTILHSKDSAVWIPPTEDVTKVFWQMDLLLVHNVTGIATQGRSDMDRWVKTYQIALSNDCISWHFLLMTDGSKKVFTGSFERGYVVFNSINQKARYLRLYPKSFHNKLQMRFEVYAWPTQECQDVISDGEIQQSAKCAGCLGRKGWSVCPQSVSDKAVIAFNHLYLATQLVITIPRNMQWDSTDITISLGNQAGLHRISENEYLIDNETNGSGWKSRTLRLRRVWKVSKVKLEMNSTAWSPDGCLSFWMKACLAQHCPPGFVQHGRRCLWPVSDRITPSTNSKNRKICERITWDQSAFLASVHDIEEHGLVSIATARHRYGGSFLGLHNTSASTWSWIDGSKVDFTAWDNNQPSSDADKTMVMNKAGVYSWHNAKATTALTYVCSTDAVNLDDKVTWKWFATMNRGLKGAGEMLLEGLSLADCMEACTKVNNCSAISSGYKSRTCHLYDSNRTQVPGVTFTSSGFADYEYAERYFNVCGQALIWGPDGVGASYVSGSTYTGDKLPSKAKLGNPDGHFRVGVSLNSGDYLQVDLRRVVKMNRVSLQGSAPSTGETYHCDKFVMLTSNDSIYWTFTHYEAAIHDSVNDHRIPSVYFFRPYVFARYFRLECHQGQGAWRMELYGCDIGMPYDMGCAVELIGYEYRDPKTTLVAVNGESANSWQNENKITLVTLNMTEVSCRMNTTHVYDLNSNGPAREFSSFLRNLPNGTVIAAATAGQVHGGLANYKDTLKDMFNIDVSSVGVGNGFVFIAKVGDASYTRFNLGEDRGGSIHLAEKLKPFPHDSDSTLAHLGIGTGHISIDQLSFLNGGSRATWIQSHAKLFIESSMSYATYAGWLSDYFKGQWFQVDLYILHEIHGIITQGSGDEVYFLKTMSVSVSNDTVSWNSIKRNDTNKQVVYHTNYQRLWPIFSPIKPHALARAVRLFPKSVNGHAAIRLEVVGRPYDYSTLNLQEIGAIVKSSDLNGQCILLPSCPSGLCLTSPANIWVQVDLRFLYHVTKLTFDNNGTSQVTLEEIKYSSSPDLKFRVILTNRTYWSVDQENRKELRMVPHVKAWILHLSLTWKNSACLSISVHGTKATACPPGMTQDGERCFYIHPLPIHVDLLTSVCSDIDWVDTGTIPVTKTFYDTHQYRKFANSRNTLPFLIGLRKHSNGSWIWADGESATGVEWRTAHSHSCATVDSAGFLAGTSCTVHNYGGCSTKAAVAAEDTCVQRWIGRPSSCINGYSTTRTKLPDILQCLNQCELQHGNNTSSVQISTASYGTCQCNTVNSTNQPVTTCAGYTFYESYCRSIKEWKSLLVELSNITKPKFTASSETTSLWSADQAFLNTEAANGKMGCWLPTKDSVVKEWLQVELASMVKFQDIIIQGCGINSVYFVKTLSLAYRNITTPGWTVVRNEDGTTLKEFGGSDERYLHQTVHLLEPVVAQVVRWILRTKGVLSHAGLRVDLRGVVISGRPSPFFPEYGPLGMESKQIGDNQLKVSSYAVISSRHSLPRAARLNLLSTSKVYGAWIPFPKTASNQWFQISFSVEHDIHGITMIPAEDATSFTYQYSLSHSQDDVNWEVVQNENNQTKKYAGGLIQHYRYGEFVSISPALTTKFLRIIPVSSHGSHTIKFELYGKVSEFKEDILLNGVAVSGMDMSYSSVSSSCDGDDAVVPFYQSTFNCSMWCFSESTKQTSTLKFPRRYFLSSIIVTESTSSVLSQYKISATDGKTFNVLPNSTVGQTTHQNATSETSYKFQVASLVKAVTLEVTPMSNTLTCVRLSARGVVAPGCPPGYAQYGRRCIRFEYHATDPTTAQQYCKEEGDSWLGGGTLVKADNMYMVNFLAPIVETGNLLTWSGGVLNGGTWQWSDGAPMTWSMWAYTGPQTNAAFSSEARLVPSDPVARSYACQIDSAEKDSDVSWIHLGHRTLTVPWSHTIPSYNTTECLRACLVGLVEGCTSVWHQKHSQSCVLTRATLSAGGLVLTEVPANNNSGGDYWEIYRGGTCDTPLLIRRDIEFTLTVSSQLDNQHSKDQVLYGDKPASGKAGFWKSSGSDTNPYMEVTFTAPVTLGRMVIVGNEKAASPEYINTFKLTYSADGNTWATVTDVTSLTEVIQGNTGPKQPTVVAFPGLPLGKTFRVTLLTWNNSASAQIELFGCAQKETITCVHSPAPELSIPGMATVTMGCLQSWTVIMRRCSPEFDFQRTWNEYTKGFGTLPCDYYAGNAAVYYYTRDRPYFLRFDIYSVDGHFYSAEFEGFRLADEMKRFQLSVGSYLNGSAGEGAMASYNNKKFSTVDLDNSGFNCSAIHSGGWWYDSSASCMKGRPTGKLGQISPQGSMWFDDRGRNIYARKIIVRMKPSDPDRLNVALKKKAWRYPDDMTDFGPGLATDGSSDFTLASKSCTQASAGKDPWFVVNLERNVRITEVKVLNTDSSPGNLHDFNVYVGPVFSQGNFLSGGYTLCAKKVGPVGPGEWAIVQCSSTILGQYVAIQIPGTTETLNFCEIAVFTTIVTAGLYSPCEWNAQCLLQYSECRPPFNDTTETMQCRCKRYYQEANGKCVPTADIIPVLTRVDTAGNKIVRNHNARLTLDVDVKNYDSALFGTASSGDNFQPVFFLSNANASTNGSSGSLEDDRTTFNIVQSPDLKFGMKISETKQITFQMDLNISPDTCLEVHYLCINLSSPSSASYIAVNKENDISCFNIHTHIVCQPEIDMSLSNVNYRGIQIARDRPGNYSFELTVAHTGSSEYDIATFKSGKKNFVASYCYANKDWTGNLQVLSQAVLFPANLTLSDASTSIAKGSHKVLNAIVTHGMNFTDCYNITHLCFVIFNGSQATFSDSKMANNVKCFLLTITKDCEPDVALNIASASLTGQSKFIRGYTDPHEFEIMIENVDPYVDVKSVGQGSINFNVSVYASDTGSAVSRRRRSTPTKEGPFIAAINEDTKVGLATKSNMTLTGTVSIILSRGNCLSMSTICYVVSSGPGASFQVKGGKVVLCSDISQYKNCNGLAVQNCSLSQNGGILLRGNSMTYTVSWDIGTDVHLSLYSSKEAIASWNWMAGNHSTSYKAMSLTFIHPFKHFGNFSVQLNISNQVGVTLLNVTTMVEPNINNILIANSSYVPKATPNDFSVVLSCANISKLDAPVIVWCSFNFNDDSSPMNIVTDAFGTVTTQAMVFNHTYLTDKADAKPSATCWNHVSRLNYTTTAILRESVTGTNVTLEALQWPTLKPMSVNISLSKGSHVKYNVSFGDGTSGLYAHPNRLSAKEEMKITKTFASPGNYTINVFSFNEHYNDTFSSPYTVKVQNPVGDLDFKGGVVIPFPPGVNTYSIINTNRARFPSDVFAKFELNHSEILTEFCPNVSKGLPHSTSLTFDSKEISHNFTFRIISYNLVSIQVYNTYAYFIERIENLNVASSLKAAIPGQNIDVSLSILNGSNVNFEINYGDGQVININHTENLPRTRHVTVQKAYNNIGNFTILVKASNLLNSKTFTLPCEIVIQNPIDGITLTANDSVLYTPAKVDFFLQFSKRQLSLNDVHCLWTYDGKLSETIYHSSISAGLMFHQMRAFPRSFIGNMTSMVNCSNLVSYQTTTFATEIILDAVILDSLVSNGSVFVTNTSAFVLNIKRFGPKSCFQWDMGDGKSVVMYGLPVCKPFADVRGIPFTVIPDQDMTIVHEYVYDAIGKYDVKVEAFNHVSNHTLVTLGVVLEWYCFRPNISFPDNITDKANPPVYMRSQSISIPPILEVDCMKTEDIDYTWTVYQANDLGGKPVFIQYQTSNFQTGPRIFDYGDYFVNLTIQMHEIPHTNQTGGFYLRIIKTPLVVAIQGNSTKTLTVYSDYTLNAINVSFDPDVEHTNKTGLHFIWRCRMVNSSFDLTEVIQDEVDSDVRAVLNKPTGCFGEDPGIIPEQDGSFKVKTKLMIPNSLYKFTLEVTKDDRTGKAEQDLALLPVEKPSMKVICRFANCRDRIGVTTPFVLGAYCLSQCGTKFGDVRYLWSLSDLTSNSSLYDLNGKTLEGTNKKTLRMLPNTMTPGRRHHATLVAWSPGSSKTRVNFDFLTNQPVSGGSCEVSPKDGRASITPFSIKCFGWKEWRSLTPNAPLKYSYFTKQPSSNREFPFAYGMNLFETEPTVFPVGQFDMEFRLDAVVYIYDSVNDPFRFSMPVKVLPRPQPAEEVMDAVVELTGPDSPIIKLMTNGSNQQAAAFTHSLTSELNVPTSLYGGNTTNASYLEAVRVTKVTARYNLMTLAVQLPVEDPEQLLQNNEITKNVMAFRNELKIETLEMGSGRLDNLTSNFREFKKQGQVANPELMADDLVSTTATCMGAADYLLQTSLRKVSQNETNSTTTESPIETTTASQSDVASVTQKAANVMRSAVNVLNEIGETLVEGKEPGDPESVIQKDEVSVNAATLSPSQMKKTTQVTSPQGEVVLPPAAQLFGNNTPSCIDRKIFFVRKNPYIYGSEKDINVASSVMSMKVTTCEGKLTVRRKKRATPTDIQPSAPISISLMNTNVPPAKLVSIVSQSDIVYHSLNLSSPPVTIQLSAKPLQFEIIKIYIDFGRKPTASSHKLNFTLPKRNDNSSSTNFALTESEYTVTLSANTIANALMREINSTNETATASPLGGNVTVNPSSSRDSDNTSDANTIFVGVQKEGCLPTFTCKTGGNFSYWFRISEIKVRQFDPASELWNDTNSEILEDSEPDRLKFKSNLFGSLGVGMFSGPNKIDFSTVFDNFGAKLVENMPVVGTVIGVILLYAIGLVICRKMDKIDAWKWSALPLIGNVPSEQHDYEIVVYTGNQRHAATESNIFFILAGINGDTGIRQMSDGSRKNFQRGHINSFLLKTSADLGELMTMSIWHDSSGENNKHGWFLDKVVVVDKRRGLWSVFHCNKWLDENFGDGNTRCILRVSTHDLSDSAVLFRQNLNRKLFDDHLWLSLAGRQTASNFSRSQRLSVCLALLYLTMITNAMFYRGVDESKETQSGVITLGPIAISVNELLNSIKASLIVILPVILITIFFTKSRPSKNITKVDDNKIMDFMNGYYAKKRISTISPDTKKQVLDTSTKLYELEKRRYPLPWWCVRLGWLLVFLAVLSSAFFTILYSFQWGGVKSRAWLIAFFLSFFESVIIIQPFKVLVITVIITFLFRKDTDVKDFEDSFGQPQNWFDVYSKPESLNLPELEDTNVVQDAQHKQVMSKKASTMMREVIVQAILLCLLLVVTYSNQDSRVYRQHQDMMNILNGYREVHTKVAFITWIQDAVLPGLYYTNDYRGNPVSKYDQKFISSTYAMRLGPPKMRQIRVKMEECRIPSAAMSVTKRCGNWYNFNSGSTDRTAYTVGWKSKKYSVGNNLKALQKAFIYRTSSTLRSVPLWGSLTTYEGGGYVANLGQNLSFARSMLSDLSKNSWVDRYTRAVLLEFNVLNIQSGLFSQVILSSEFPPVGGAYHWLSLTSVQLYRYTGAVGAINIVTELTCVLIFLVFSVYTIKDLISKRLAFFKRVQSVTDLLVILCFCIAMALYAYRSVWTVRQVEYMMHHWGETVNFHRVVSSDRMFMIFLGLTTFIVTLQFLVILRYNHTIAMLSTTLAASAMDIAGMGGVLFIVLAAFVSCANISFGSKMIEYSTMRNTIMTLTSSCLGKFSFDDIGKNSGFGGRLFLLIYLLTMILLFLNLFITLLCNFMEAVRGDSSVIPKDHEVVDYMLESVKAFIVSENQDNVEDAEDKETLTETNQKQPAAGYHRKSVLYSSEA